MAITRRGDVHIVPTPGHTPDHVSVVVDGDPAMFIAGDASYNQELLLARKLDGVSPNARIAQLTMDRIMNLARQRPLVYLPSHDANAERRLERMSTLFEQCASPVVKT
jgi:glyoxylase-like metal-dependent hydrolase (beta-lactamase superfamily II)